MRTTSDRSSATVPVPRTPGQEDLAAALTGVLLLPGEQHPDVGVPAVDGVLGPDAVVVAGDAADVALAVHWARSCGLRLAVRSAATGGTTATPGTLLVVTTGLTDVHVDPAGTAEVGAGVLWRELLAAAAPYGLTSAGGAHAPAGGRVLALHVVTADGVRRRVSARAHPDLFRALHGGRSTLAVVTGVELGLVPVGPASCGAGCSDRHGAEADDRGADPVLAALTGWSSTPEVELPEAEQELVRRYDPDRLFTADAVNGP